MTTRDRGAATLVRLALLAQRLLRHEWALLASLVRWITGRPHGVAQGDTAVAYAGGQTLSMSLTLFASVTETVVLALLIPWPLAHLVLLLLGLWGVFLVLGIHAACVTRPHVLRADGSLRVRYGALVDIHVPAERIVSLRLERRHPEGSLLSVNESGEGNGQPVVDLVVGGQTSVTALLDRPVTFARPLGRIVQARTIRFSADDPSPLRHAAGSRTEPSGSPHAG